MISLAEVIIQFITIVDELSRELLGGIPSYGRTLTLRPPPSQHVCDKQSGRHVETGVATAEGIRYDAGSAAIAC